jgi:hypothetical protein
VGEAHSVNGDSVDAEKRMNASATIQVGHDREERADGTAEEEGKDEDLDDCHHDSSPKIPSHPSHITSFTSIQIDTLSYASDPSSRQPWTWGPHSTCQKVIDFLSAKDAIRFDMPGETGGNTEPLIADVTLEGKHD